jgi:hypothetical protein
VPGTKGRSRPPEVLLKVDARENGFTDLKKIVEYCVMEVAEKRPSWGQIMDILGSYKYLIDADVIPSRRQVKFQNSLL